MWLFTPFGFYSIVQKPGDTDLTVRARVRADLDALRARYLPTLGPVQARGGTDYPFRATVAREALADAMAAIARDVTYPNFKNAVAAVSGPNRAHAYFDVWASMARLERGRRRGL